jgi:hypothetical protein
MKHIEKPGAHAGAPNPFNPDSLRITGDVNAVGAEKLLVRLPVRKPTKQEFFQVRVDAEYRLPCAILEIKDDREFYLVTPEALPVLAEKSWIRMIAVMAEGGYSIYRATGTIPDPQWPEKTFQELLQIAFKDGKLIESEDHPVVQQLNGA